jgi:hypothetical protein
MASAFDNNRDPIDVLCDDEDPSHRSRAHLELGLRAKARSDLELAEFHLREALDLDPTDEITKEELRAIGRPVVAQGSQSEEAPRPGLLGRIFGGLRRKTTLQ